MLFRSEKEFHEKMHAAHMYGLWELASQMTKRPEPTAIPYMWKASLIEALVREAGEAVPVGEERRRCRRLSKCRRQAISSR